MSTLKTHVNDGSVEDFIASVENDQKRHDSLVLLDLYQSITGETPKMWGTSMIGFGAYHYKSERSAQEGDWPLVAFSPRKQNLTLYVMPGFAEYRSLLDRLGPHKTSVGCLYIKRLSDVDMSALRAIIKKSYEDMKRNYSDQEVTS